jgi:hypothetical protein
MSYSIFLVLSLGTVSGHCTGGKMRTRAVAAAVELQFSTELARLKSAELRQVMALVEKALRKVGT